jgi:hypothetical protein
MSFFLTTPQTVKDTLRELKESRHLEKQYKAVKRTLGYLAENPRHPSLQTHPYESFKGPSGEKVFEAYAEQDTPGAYRIFFYYGKQRGEIVILAVVPHP